MAARWPNICCSGMSQPSEKMSRSEKVKGSLAPVNGRRKLVEDSHAMALKSKSTCGLACKQSFWIMRACNRKTRPPPFKTPQKNKKKVTVAAKAGQFKRAAANVLHQITGAVCNLLDFTLLALHLVVLFV